MSVLETINVTKVYRGKKGTKIQALSNLDISVNRGEVFGFLGPNGAGKSTTIKILMGQIRPTAGTASVNGIQVSDPSARKQVGYLQENPAFYDFMTAREYLRFVGTSFGMAKDRIAAQTEKVLDLLELGSAAARPIRGFSKGMVQRLGMAQALLHEPDLYILDEPMSGLDPIGRALVKDIIMELKGNGKTVFFSTHITDDVEAVCDRVGILVAGKLQTINTVKDILERGVEGYCVRMGVANGGLPSGYKMIREDAEEREYFVGRENIQEFMSEVVRLGGKIDMIEPRRKNLQTFFLDIVAQSNK